MFRALNIRPFPSAIIPTRPEKEDGHRSTRCCLLDQQAMVVGIPYFLYCRPPVPASRYEACRCIFGQIWDPERMRAKVVEESFVKLSVALYTGLIGKEANHKCFCASLFEPTRCSHTSACFHSLSNVRYTPHKLRKRLLSWRSSCLSLWLLVDFGTIEWMRI